jgi:cytidylate kinase
MVLKARLRIAISGKSGSGKTALSNHLVQKLGGVRASTGDIYRDVSRLLYGEATKDLMNLLTQTLRRMDTNCVLRAALRTADNGFGIVCDSMRFNEDYSFLRTHGFLLVRLQSAVEVRHERLRQRGEIFSPHDLENDPTETALDDATFDCFLLNDGTDLSVFLDDALTEISNNLKM